MELLWVGCMVEITEPQSMRKMKHDWARDIYELYKNY